MKPSLTKTKVRSSVLGAAVVGAFVLASTATPAMAAEADTSAFDAVAAANPAAVEQSAAVSRTSDAIVDAELGGVDVNLPSDASDGIGLARADGTGTLKLSLPFAEQAADAEHPAAGVAEYDNGNASTTVPVAVDDGSVAVHTVIESADAPTAYS